MTSKQRGFSAMFLLQVLWFLPLLYRAKAFEWLDRMLHHRADPINTLIGVDNSQNRSRLGVQVK